jgi:peptidylprolyl isomerase
MMKVRRWIPILLLVPFAFSLDAPAPQEAPATSVVQHPARPSSPALSKSSRPTGMPRAIAPTADVISVDGLCQPGDVKHRECKTSVTRAQFEALVTALPLERRNPGQQMSPAAKRQFAMQYSHLLVLATEAEKRGLQNTQAARELLQYARLQVMAQMLTHYLQGTTRPTLEEVKSYYTANQERFVELTLQRVYVPAHQLADGKTNEAEMRASADDLHQRAATIAEFSELQAEVNEKADIKNPPESRIVLPANALPATQEAVRKLKVGELSQVIQDPSGFFIYKLEAIRPLALEMAAKEIQDILTELKMQQQIGNTNGAS